MLVGGRVGMPRGGVRKLEENSSCWVEMGSGLSVSKLRNRNGIEEKPKAHGDADVGHWIQKTRTQDILYRINFFYAACGAENST